MRFRYLLLAVCVVYLVHMYGYIRLNMLKEEGNHFSLVVTKGDNGLTMDYTIFGTQIKDSWENKNIFFQRDIYTASQTDKYFPNGNLIYFLCSLPLAFGLDITWVFVLMPFFAIFLALFFLDRILREFFPGGDRRFAFLFIIGTVLLCLTDATIFNPLSYLSVTSPPSYRYLNYMTRFPHIGFSFFMPVLWLYTLIRQLKRPGWAHAVYLGLVLLLLQYSYFYFFTAALLMTVLVLIFHFSGLWQHWKLYALTALIYVGGALPFWILFFRFNASAIGMEYAVRVGQEMAAPYFGWVPLLVSLVFLWIDYRYLKARGEMEGWFSVFRASALNLSLLLTLVICMNIQYVVGYTVQNYHWFRTFYRPLVMVLATIAIGKLLILVVSTRWKRILKYGIGILLAGIVGVAGMRGYQFGNFWKDYFVLTPAEVSFIRHINRYEGKVFFCQNVNVMGLVAAHSPNYMLVPNAFLSQDSNHEILRRLVYGYKRMGYTLEEIEREIAVSEGLRSYQQRILSGKAKNRQITDNYNLLSFIGHLTYYDPEKWYVLSDALKQELAAIYQDPALSYPLDYLVLYKPTLKCCLVFSSKECVFENDDFLVYSLP